MPSSIKLRTFSGIPDSGQDQRAVLSNSNFVRPFYVGDWNKIRVCARLSVTWAGVGALPIPNHVAIGLCSGSEFPFNSPNTKQFVGGIAWMGSGPQQVVAQQFVGPPFHMNGRFFPGKKIGTALTGVLGASTIAQHLVLMGFVQFNGDGTPVTGVPKRSLYFVDITRPNSSVVPTSGQYPIAFLYRKPDPNYFYDATKADFLSLAVNPALTTNPITDHTYATTPTQFGFPGGAAVEIGVDETGISPLDHICIASDDVSYNVEISEVGIVKLA